MTPIEAVMIIVMLAVSVAIVGLLFALGWGLADIWDAIRYSPSREARDAWKKGFDKGLDPLKSQLEHVGDPDGMVRAARIRMEEVDGYDYAEITDASYVADGVILFAMGSIRRYPKDFSVRAGYNIWDKNPFRGEPSSIRAGVSFHPQARGNI